MLTEQKPPVNSERPLIGGFSIIGVIQRLIQNPVKHIRCGDFWENCIRLKVVNYFNKLYLRTPVFKKGEKECKNSYRPVSILSKVFE